MLVGGDSVVNPNSLQTQAIQASISTLNLHIWKTKATTSDINFTRKSVRHEFILLSAYIDIHVIDNMS